MRSRLRLVLAVLVLTAAAAPSFPRAEADVEPTPDPTVEGPIGDTGIHGHPWYDPAYEVESIGFVEEEYFVSGTARTFTTATPSTADYNTRIFVVRPADPADFNGTVVVEWDNVTAQGAFSPMWTWLHPLLLREGYAFVSVSAQAAGICCSPLSHQGWDPVRYGELSHPGDDYSFDIFSQVVQALQSPAGIDPLGSLDPERVIATGNSQSASRLYTYINAVQDQAGLIDGFQIHGGGGKAFAGPSVPVMHLFSEREINSAGAEAGVADNYRMWELPGSSHNDADTARHIDGGKAARNSADAPKQPYETDEELHAHGMPYGQQGPSTFAGCQVIGQGGNEYPVRYAIMANLHQLDQWLRTGVGPAPPPRVQFNGTSIVRDGFRHPLGGVRLPPLDVPVARYFATTCELFGHTVALTPMELLGLYPTHDGYVSQMQAATNVAVDNGWLLPVDAAELMGMATASHIPYWAPAP
jgi:hypothetical protein